jgi:hypothetical protein
MTFWERTNSRNLASVTASGYGKSSALWLLIGFRRSTSISRNRKTRSAPCSFSKVEDNSALMPDNGEPNNDITSPPPADDDDIFTSDQTELLIGLLANHSAEGSTGQRAGRACARCERTERAVWGTTISSWNKKLTRSAREICAAAVKTVSAKLQVN